MLWPRSAARCWVTTRATVSVGPPAGYGTTTLMGRSGKVCAGAALASARIAQMAMAVRMAKIGDGVMLPSRADQHSTAYGARARARARSGGRGRGDQRAGHLRLL